MVDLIDLDRLNDSPIHLIVTAVDVETGALITFENKNRHEPFSLEMVLASGSIAPVFPMTHATEQRTGAATGRGTNEGAVRGLLVLLR